MEWKKLMPQSCEQLRWRIRVIIPPLSWGDSKAATGKTKRKYHRFQLFWLFDLPWQLRNIPTLIARIVGECMI